MIGFQQVSGYAPETRHELEFHGRDANLNSDPDCSNQVHAIYTHTYTLYIVYTVSYIFLKYTAAVLDIFKACQNLWQPNFISTSLVHHTFVWQLWQEWKDFLSDNTYNVLWFSVCIFYTPYLNMVKVKPLTTIVPVYKAICTKTTGNTCILTLCFKW